MEQIKVEELRVGNLLLSSETIVTVEEIRYRHARVRYKRVDNGEEHVSLVEYSNLAGIPLTEEWLLKMGFEETFKSKYRTLYDLVDNAEFGFDIIHHGDYAKGMRYIGEHFPHVEFVHQLQNTVFALSGQDLTIKQ